MPIEIAPCSVRMKSSHMPDQRLPDKSILQLRLPRWVNFRRVLFFTPQGAATRLSSPSSGTLPDSKRPAPQHTSTRTGHLPQHALGNTSRPANTTGLPLPQSPTSARLESVVWGVHARGTLRSTPLPLFSWPASWPTRLGSRPLRHSA